MPAMMSKPKGQCPGASCPGCSSANCMAEGGKVPHGKAWDRYRAPDEEDSNPDWADKEEEEEEESPKPLHLMGKPKKMAEGGSVKSATKREDHEKGVNQSRWSSAPGMSSAGHHVRSAMDTDDAEDKQMSMNAAKRDIQNSRVESSKMPKPKLAKGGEVDEEEDNDGSLDRNYYVKGIHTPFAGQGTSQMGQSARGHWSHGDPERNKKHSQGQHQKIMSEMGSMKKPNLYAEGGEVDSDSDEIDHELKGMMGEEFLSAIDSKDKKRIMESLEAIVLHHLHKE